MTNIAREILFETSSQILEATAFLSLGDSTELLYMISTDYVPESARGFRWNDPAIGITWPLAPVVISARDASLPAFAPAAVA